MVTTLGRKHRRSDLHRTIVQYLISKAEAPNISIREAVEAVRQRTSDCGLFDRELGDLIATNAIEVGFDVNFNGSATTQ